MIEDDCIRQDWIEFEQHTSELRRRFVNVKRTEISEILSEYDSKGEDAEWCTIVLKNGRTYVVEMPYAKVMELI